eukprot:CAMPEP_0113853178 /NCGR_PEP_ID=MMETSP0372-20130328/6150_1 /TAXON_ID=340204 /ORGANISM="Lankesteria abbotti" /LENGTH=102 /DNA_ID=CAMNT_0000825267 /DNA_START=92 /DNA_END=400 /DNA_ORIENTATION=- /assembly_acc=CAM_ASM_000359
MRSETSTQDGGQTKEANAVAEAGVLMAQMEHQMIGRYKRVAQIQKRIACVQEERNFYHMKLEAMLDVVSKEVSRRRTEGEATEADRACQMMLRVLTEEPGDF